MEFSSDTSKEVIASRSGPTLSCTSMSSSADSGSRQHATTALPSCFARICVTNSSPMPRLAPVTTTVAFSIGPPGTYAPAEAEAVA